MKKPIAKRFHVIAMMGDYHLAHQPFWSQTFTDLDSAIRAADATWQWMRGEKEWYYDSASAEHGPYDTSLTDYPLGSPETSHGPFVLNVALCVFVFDPDADELVERPFYVRGNPACDTEDA